MPKLAKDQAYCVKCHKAVKMTNPTVSKKKNPNGTHMKRGKCVKCKGKVCRIVK